MRSRPLTRAKNRRENEELDMYKLGLDMVDSQSGNAAAIEEAPLITFRVENLAPLHSPDDDVVQGARVIEAWTTWHGP